jgi:Reverse transcriptase (RNA-dependent DNA polymerase)
MVQLNDKKTHLVAKRCHQKEGINYFKIFSPVVRPTTIRVVLTLAFTHGWPVKQLDVHDVFLHGDFHETMYMHHPL